MAKRDAGPAVLVGMVVVFVLAAVAALVPVAPCPACRDFNVETVFDRVGGNYFVECARCKGTCRVTCSTDGSADRGFADQGPRVYLGAGFLSSSASLASTVPRRASARRRSSSSGLFDRMFL